MKFFAVLLHLFLVLLLFSCSPTARDKVIRGKEVTAFFFQQFSGDYKNGENKQIRFYRDPSHNKPMYQLNVRYGENAGYAQKVSDGFQVITSQFIYDNQDKNRFNFQAECQLSYTGEVSKVEEIPQVFETEKLSPEFRNAKNNPIPLKYFIYPAQPAVSFEVTQIYEPKENQFTNEEWDQLKEALKPLCKENYRDDGWNDIFRNGNYYYGSEKYFATTAIETHGFIMLNSNSITSLSKSHYQPQSAYYYQSRYSIVKDIEFSKENTVKKRFSLRDSHYVVAQKSEQDNFLKGSYKNTPRGSRDEQTEVSFQSSLSSNNSLEESLILKIKSKETYCNQSYTLELPVQEVEWASKDEKRKRVLTIEGARLNDYNTYINSHLDIQTSIHSLVLAEVKESKENQGRSLMNCPVIEKLKKLQEQNVALFLAFTYNIQGPYLRLVILDNHFQKVLEWDQLIKSSEQ